MTICTKTTAYEPTFGMPAAGARFAIAGTRAVAPMSAVRTWRTDLRNVKHDGTRAWRSPESSMR